MANINDTGLTLKPKAEFILPKIKIKLIKPKMIMWPAVMFANKRTINTKGFVNTPIISTIGMSGTGNFSHHGTPGALTMCFQYPLFPLNVVIKKVNRAKTSVTAMLPVTFAPPGKIGISPKRLLISIKKNVVNKKGKNRSYFFSPMEDFAMSSRINRIMTSKND